jgi:hypothetical protein
LETFGVAAGRPGEGVNPAFKFYEVAQAVSYSRVSISNSTVANNTSNLGAGGGLAVGGNATVELLNGTVVANNSAVEGAGGGAALFGTATLRSGDGVVFVNKTVSKGFEGSFIAALENATLLLPAQGKLTRCSADVFYLRLPGC